MCATLKDLMSEDELKQIPKHLALVPGDWVKNITVNDLSWLAFVLIRADIGDSVPECILSAKAIELLTERAKKKGIGIF